MKRSGGISAADVDFADWEQTRAWFQSQPRAICAALATRSALRVLPLIDSYASHPVLRACFVAWCTVKYPSQSYLLRSKAGAAARAADAAAHNDAAARAAARAARAASRAAASRILVASGADTDIFTEVTISAASAYASTVIQADVFLPAYEAALTLAATAVRVDAVAIEQGRPVAEIMAAPLWPREIPGQITAAWDRLRAWMLEDEANSWEPWVQWYERVRDGRPSFGEAFDLAVALLTDAQWNEVPRPAAVNRRIAALLAEHTPPEPIPPQGPGPHFTLGLDLRIALAPPSEIDAEGNNVRRIREQLPLVRRVAERLANTLNVNAFPELAQDVADYRAAISDDTAISWGLVFGLGVMLENAAIAAERHLDDPMWPRLEDAPKAALDSLLTLHGPLILATAEGRELSEDADRERLTREEQAELRVDAEALADKLRRAPNVIEPLAAAVVVKSTEAIGEGRHPERGTVFGIATVKNVSIPLIGVAAAYTVFGLNVVEAGGILVVVEALKKSEAFGGLTGMLGQNIDRVFRFGAAYRRFVCENEEALRNIASKYTNLRWMLSHIDAVVRASRQKDDES